eukprot:gene29831-36949_t
MHSQLKKHVTVEKKTQIVLLYSKAHYVSSKHRSSEYAVKSLSEVANTSSSAAGLTTERLRASSSHSATSKHGTDSHRSSMASTSGETAPSATNSSNDSDERGIASSFHAHVRNNKTSRSRSNSDSSSLSSCSQEDLSLSHSSIVRECPVFARGPHDRVADELVKILAPRESQLQCRAGIAAFVKKQVRLALNVSAFDVTLNELHCALPDDVLKLSVVINQQDVAQWYKPLMERLGQVAERSSPIGCTLPPLEDVVLPTGFDLFGAVSLVLPSQTHSVFNVQLTTNKLSYKISCVVNGVSVEIVANNRVELVFLAFFEEVDALVGQDHMFKRSVMLIRAWWTYEASNCIGMDIKHYIPDNSMCVMVAAIFNQHHDVIASPLQALSLFLREYSQFNGTTHTITLQGVVPFEAHSANATDKTFLFDAQLITKYRKVMNINSSSSAADCAAVEDACLVLAADCVNTEAIKFAESVIQRRLLAPSKNVLKSPVSSSSLPPQFERADFSVVNPFDGSNMMIANSENNKLSSGAVARIMKVFVMSA